MILLDAPPGTDPMRGPRRGVMILLQAIALSLILVLVWANYFQIAISATGNGRIVPSHQVQVVQNLEGGIVSEILVKEGDAVKAGQPLARIQDTEFIASYKEAQDNIAGLQAAIARLTAQIDGKDPQFPEDLKTQHPDLVSKELTHYQSAKAELTAVSQGIEQEIERSRNDIRKIQENQPILERSLALANEQRAITEPQVKHGLISRVELLSLDQRILELKAKINEANREIPAEQATIGENQHRIDAEREKARGQALGELTEAKVKLSGQMELLTAHKDRVARREMTSPVNGVVKKNWVTSIGEVLKPGQSIFEIVPTDDLLIVEARFSPKDIAFIHPGQQAFVRVTAYDSSIYGALPAHVMEVAADATVPEREEPYYVVRVQAADGEHKDVSLLSGMTAQVDVQTGKRSVFEYVAKPIMKLRYSAMHER